MSRRFMFGCFAAVCGAGLAQLTGGVGEARAGEEVHEVQKLTASDAAAEDWFGYSVSVSGDTVVVGAYLDDCPDGDRCGSAYVYRFDGATWVQEQKLTASDTEYYDQFGVSVSVSGDTAVVGAPYHDGTPYGLNYGSAYVFRYDGTMWALEQMLTASDADSFDLFGVSVSVNGNMVVVGAYRDDCAAGYDCGSAYVFRFDPHTLEWVEEQKLTASDAAEYEHFGRPVSVSGDTIAVGVSVDDCAAGDHCGSAYVFRFDPKTSQWVEEQKLTASNADTWDLFGGSVSVSGDTVVVGATGDDCVTGGSAYVFRFNPNTSIPQWVEEQKLAASDTAASDGFGRAVSVRGDTVVVGASGGSCSGGGSHCGSAYVFRFDGSTWVEEHKLAASDGAGSDNLGRSVSLSGDTVVAGAYGYDCAAGIYCGAAYVFSLAVPTESYPPGDSIDARQPSDLGCTELFGWDSIAINYNGDTAVVLASDFTVSVDPADVNPPVIVNVVPTGNTATLEFDMRIPLGHWTIITHDASGFSTRIGALPGDVSGDRATGPVDILDLIDFLNVVGPALEIWQTDIDRSSEANPADILTAIDLLNGASCFDQWNGATLPE